MLGANPLLIRHISSHVYMLVSMWGLMAHSMS